MRRVLSILLLLAVLAPPVSAATLRPDTILIDPVFFSDPSNPWPSFGLEGNGTYFGALAVQDTDPRTGQPATFLYVNGGQSDSGPLRPGYVNCHADEVILFVYPAGQEQTPWNQFPSTWRNDPDNVVRVSDCENGVVSPYRTHGQPFAGSNGEGFITFGVSNARDFWEVRLARSSGSGKWRDFSDWRTLIQAAPSRRCKPDGKRPDGSFCNYPSDNLTLVDVHLQQTGSSAGWLVFQGAFRFGAGMGFAPSTGFIQVVYNPATFERMVWVMNQATGWFVQLPPDGSIDFDPIDMTPGTSAGFGPPASFVYNPILDRYELWRGFHRAPGTNTVPPPGCTGTETAYQNNGGGQGTSEPVFHVMDPSTWSLGPMQTVSRVSTARPLPADYGAGYTGAGPLYTTDGRQLFYTGHRDRNICTDDWGSGQAEAAYQGLYVTVTNMEPLRRITSP
ncbi:MAG TPA: hypothetical protein VHQ65_09465 [Thermoanaerobaculia bacterium]|nr:hypothetical protein [Thermoanaerobaculia bacterium]